MNIDYNSIISALSVLMGVIISTFYARRAKKAEVRAREIENAAGYITNADMMIELVKKANAEVAQTNEKLINTLREENEKTRKSIEKLERAIKRIDLCPHRNLCPVYDELQNPDDSSQRNRKNGKGANRGNPSGHDGDGTARQGVDTSVTGV